MKTLSILGCLFPALCLFAQDTTWKLVRIDENLTISLPHITSTIDTILNQKDFNGRFRVFNATTENVTIGVTIGSNAKIKADNQESLQTVLRGVKDGVCASASSQGLSCSASDTSIDNIQGKKILVYSNGPDPTVVLNDYIFLVNGNVYMITLSPFSNDSSARLLELNYMLNSIRFNHSNIKEQQFDSKMESSAHRMGYLIGKGLIIFVFIGGIVWFVVRKSSS